MTGIKSRMTCIFVKIRLFKTLTRTVSRVAMKAGNFRLLSKKSEYLYPFETNILRRIFGPARDSGMWIIKYNEELQWRFQNFSLKFATLQSSEHVGRLNSFRITTKTQSLCSLALEHSEHQGVNGRKVWKETLPGFCFVANVNWPRRMDSLEAEWMRNQR